MAILHIQGITVSFGGPPILDALDLTIQQGDRLALLGRNGAGKSTLMKVIQGELEPDDGRIIRDSGVRTAYLSQRVPEGLAGSVYDVVMEGHVAEEDDEAKAANRALTAISRVGLEPEDLVENLSAGLKRRALLARALVDAPDLLLLDEPTNHLDVDSIVWLEDFLRRYVRTFLFVTHDRAFLRSLASGILDLDRGQLVRYDEDYTRYVERKEHELDVEARSDRQSDKQRKEEETWIRQGVRERRKRNQGRVRRLMAMREDFASRRNVAGKVNMSASSAGRTGRLVVEAKGVTYFWDDGTGVRDLDAVIQRGDRVGIFGPNGSGKTTLLRLLLGEIQPTSGEIRHGANLEIGYFDQLHATLDDDISAAENVGGGNQTVLVGGKERHVVSYLGDFLFTADQARGGIRHFSGGERNRLLLARLLCRPSNVLVLDEPTNDLDIETLEVLEDLLADYEGTILVVSHDRELLDHVVTSSLVLEGGGKVGQYAGGYSDWLAQRPADHGGAKLATSKSKGKRKGKRKRGGAGPSALDKDEKRELRGLPAKIEDLEAKQTHLHAQMADPAFLRGSGGAIATAKVELETLVRAIESAYARWQALEAKRDAGAS